MINSEISVKVIGKSVFQMYDIVRNKISFLNKIQNVSLSRITDGERGKFLLPNGVVGKRTDINFGKYYLLELEDGSSVKIVPDEGKNELIFRFEVSEDNLLGLRETFLSYIDYEYDRS